MNTVKLQQRGTLTLPHTIREALNLKTGQSLRIVSEDGKIILIPEITVDSKIVRDLEQSIRDIQNGKYIEFSSIPEMHAKLDTYEN